MGPDVSVIIPFYEGGRWLPRSLSSAVTQEGTVLEVIVVDDGSSHPPRDIVSSFADRRIRLVVLSHHGKGAAVNAGAQLARGDFVCVLDQDDQMLPGRLKAQVAALQREDTTHAVYSDYERRDGQGSLIDVFTSRQASPEEMLHCLATGVSLFSIQTLLIRKRIFDELGGFWSDDRITGLDDADFFVRLLVSGCHLAYVPGVFAQWISHSVNYSKSARFQEARVAWMARLADLAEAYPSLRKELPFFQRHHYTMGGLFLLDANNPVAAARHFAKAIRAYPFGANAYYLFLKSIARSVMFHSGNRRRS
jgi:glycosyltransferase involved in cell wall biosynthesis